MPPMFGDNMGQYPMPSYGEHGPEKQGSGMSRRGFLRLGGTLAIAGATYHYFNSGQPSENDSIITAVDTTSDASESVDTRPSTPPRKLPKDRPFYIGPDVSHHNRGTYGSYVDLEALAKRGVAFAMCRAGAWKDEYFIDNDFRRYREMMYDAGMLPGTYYFLGSHEGGKKQADFYYQALKETDPRPARLRNGRDIPGLMSVDMEISPSYRNRRPTNRQATDFVVRMQELTGGHPNLDYTYSSFWNDTMRITKAHPNSKLWWARPLKGSRVDPFELARTIPKPGSRKDPYKGGAKMHGYAKWLMRQYTFDASFGPHKRVDFNITFAKWSELLKLARMQPEDVRFPVPLAKKY